MPLVKEVNYIPGPWIHLDLDDIPQTDERLHFIPEYLKSIIASEDGVSFNRSSLNNHILNNLVHLSTKDIKNISNNIKHQIDKSIHFDNEEQKNRVINLKHVRGPMGPRGPMGQSGSIDGSAIDHGLLLGLTDDDHNTGANAYHTSARAATWLAANHETTYSHTNYDTAFGWGDHSSAGYLTGESDDLDTVLSRGSTSTSENITLTNGTMTAEQITSTDDMTASGTITGETLLVGDATAGVPNTIAFGFATSDGIITSGSFSVVGGFAVGQPGNSSAEISAGPQTHGSLVIGAATEDIGLGDTSIKAITNFGIFVGGSARSVSAGATIFVSGEGTALWGRALDGILSHTGDAGSLFGQNIQLTGNFSHGLGRGYSDSTADSFNIGWDSLTHQFTDGAYNITGTITVDGTLLVDNDNTEALLIRKDGDPASGDVFVVDTTNNRVGINVDSFTSGTGIEFITLTGVSGDIAGRAIRMTSGSGFSMAGTGGGGGILSLLSGDGGNGTDSGGGVLGGDAGGYTFRAGNGGTATSSGANGATGGSGGPQSFIAGDGGVATAVTGIGAGGLGGSQSFSTGAGGAAFVSGAINNGGDGGALSLTASNGGASFFGGISGDGGSITLNSGAAGTAAAGSTLGISGKILFKIAGTTLVTIGSSIDFHANTKLDNAKFHIFDKASGNGIKVDTTTPTFGFNDIIGDQFAKNTGATKPTLTAYNGAVDAWQFGDGKEAFLSYHIQHDYAPGTDIHLHIHWSQTSDTNTGGHIVFRYSFVYSKGHNQASFTSSVITDTFNSITLVDAGTNQYRHHLTEITISAATATAALMDRDDLEPDGVIELTLEMVTNNLTDSVSVLNPFIHLADIHYQTTGLTGTKNRTPDFYA